MSDYETLALHYRNELLAKLPPASILPPSVLAAYPPGSDVSQVPVTCGLLSPAQLAITAMDATELVAQMASGALTAVAVTEAVGMRAAIAHQRECPPC